jgi:AraC-like DNA-binding protein
MRRRRRVRYIYPQAMMDLTVALSLKHEKRVVAELLSIPLSTLYRWLDIYRRVPMRFGEVDRARSNEGLRHLIAVCQARGFNIRDDLEIILGSSQPARDLLGDGDAPARNRLVRANPSRIEQASRNASQQQDFDRTFTDLERGKSVSLPAQMRMELARTRIDMRYYSKLTCEALASMTNLSKWHFIRTFRAAYGISPYHYLTQVRVLRAKRLLHTTSHSLDAIATAVGFDTQSSLSRAFKSVEGVSLSSFFRGIRLGYVPSTPRDSRGVRSTGMKTIRASATAAMRFEETV